MLINFKVKTLDAQTHDLSIDNEITVRELKDKIAEKTNIVPEQQRIIYCGRVLADEKQMKDYDVDGKVLHVAERPPPSQGGPTSRSNDNPPPRERSTLRGMRNSPLFRALDSMVTGLPNNGGMPVNPFASSSSFCMNRITVARHMLECANNIAAYLENPERGLNNTSLDILQRGRWTIESTVVEVGITAADIPQNQNIVEMVQGAVSAALRGNGGTNVTVLQLPTVFEHRDGEGPAVGSNASENDEQTNTNTSDNGNSAATVIIEDMSDSDDDQNITPDLPAAATGLAEHLSNSLDGVTNVGESIPTTTSSSTGTNTDQLNGGTRRRTPPTVLAEVIELWRNVQTRLNPFIQQYYDLLQNEPNFDASNNDQRAAAQRLFDRVSEAFHYLSHAQHAISDLMLDLSQATPRYLTCHPILVEQSGYISSNNILSAAPTAAGLGRGNLRAPISLHQQQRQTQTDNIRRNFNSTATNTNISGNVQSAINQNARFDDPVDEVPSVHAPRPVTSMNVGTQSNDDNSIEIVLQPRRPPSLWLPINNNQLPMARLIQAVVNSAPIDTEFHVQINAPIVSFGVPVNVATVHTDLSNNEQQQLEEQQQQQQLEEQQQQQQQQQQLPSELQPLQLQWHIPMPSDQSGGTVEATVTATPVAAAAESIRPASAATPPATIANSGNANARNVRTVTVAPTPIAPRILSIDQLRATTATLPTTSTQTRSTSRPQLQIGQIPASGFNGSRFIPNTMMSSFDRFLQCNSHHIREPELSSNVHNAGPNVVGNNTPNNIGHIQAAIANNTPGGAALLPPFFGVTSTPRPLGRQRTRSFVPRDAPVHLIANSENADDSRRIFLTMLTDIRNHLDRLPTARSADIPLITSTITTSTDTLTTAATAATTGTNTTTGTVTATPTSRGGVLTNINTDAYRINLRSQLLKFLSENMFQGGPINEVTIPLAVTRAIHWFTETLIFLPQYERPDFNSRDSVNNILRLTLPLFINLLIDRRENSLRFEQRLKQLFDQFINRLYSVLFLCVGRSNAELYWGQLMRLLLVPVQNIFRDEALQFLCVYITPTVPPTTDAVDAQQFIVYRNTPAVRSVLDTFYAPGSAPVPNIFQQPIDADIDMNDVASTSASAARDTTQSAPSILPNIVTGNEPWHNHFPDDWLPLISRDVDSITENPAAQPPYSDAYIAGMATKRRKVLQSNKPPATVNGLLAGNLRSALQNAGDVVPIAGAADPSGSDTTTITLITDDDGGATTNTATTTTFASAAAAATSPGTTPPAGTPPPAASPTLAETPPLTATATPTTTTTTPPPASNIDDIINTFVNDTSVQASYAEALQASIRDRVRHDNDYDSKKFPEIGKFLNNK